MAPRAGLRPRARTRGRGARKTRQRPAAGARGPARRRGGSVTAPAPDAVVEAAPAKVNLYLHVGARRRDGRRAVDSAIAFAGPGDRIAARPAPALSLEVRGPFAPALRGPAEENLALRAARALAAAAGETRGAAIALDKNLPVAAGLGGGSADAAAALRALSRLWRTGLPAAELGRLAAALGTDVPACLAGGAWRVSGAGDVLDRPARGFGPIPVVLANPGAAAPTAEVFARLRPPVRPPPPPPRLAGGAVALARALAPTRNDLEAPALELAPAIADALAALRAAPGCLLARMTGSGATCFGLFRAAGDAARAARALRRSGRGWWVRAASLGAAAPAPPTAGSDLDKRAVSCYEAEGIRET